MNPNIGIILAIIGLVVFLLIWAVNIYRDRYIIKSIYVDWRTKRAQDWLLKNDSTYQMRYIGNEIVRRRDEARARNANADELDKIDYYSVAKSLGLKSEL